VLQHVEEEHDSLLAMDDVDDVDTVDVSDKRGIRDFSLESDAMIQFLFS